MNYEAATCKELNITLTKLYLNARYSSADSIEFDNRQSCFWIKSAGFSSHEVVDYCTDWNATMPIAIEHNVELSPCFNGMYYAAIVESYTDEEEPLEYFGDTYDKDPLRAVVICLIKKLEQPR